MIKQAQASAQTSADIIRESLVNMMITRQKIDDDYLAQLSNVRDIHELHIHFITDSLHLREAFLDEERLHRLRLRQQSTPPMDNDEAQVLQTGEPLWRSYGEVFKAAIPFKATSKCRQCHEVPDGHVLGAAEMRISLTRISTSIENNRVSSIWLLYIFTSIALILSVIVYRILVEQRMNMLVHATKIIGGGKLDHPITVNGSRDELGQLATAFDTMRIELKKAQEQAIHSERLATIGQMASSIIHDFRSPMSTINLAIESLQGGKNFTPEKTQRWYELIRDAVHRMVIMAQELLDFSRGEAKLEKTEFSVEYFISLLVESVRLNLFHAKIELFITQQFNGVALFDPDRLHRALVNIINNAQDAMPHGGTLTITSRQEINFLVISIEDTGCGIPPEIKDKIFDAFVTAGKKKGTGLGLAITKRIIDQHGGTIEVQSERDKGTTFTIKIPIQ